MISLFKDFKTPKASISYSVNSFYIYSHSEAGITLQEKKLWENCRVALWVGAVISKSTGSFAFWSLRDRPCSHQKMYDKNKKKKHEKKKGMHRKGNKPGCHILLKLGSPWKLLWLFGPDSIPEISCPFGIIPCCSTTFCCPEASRWAIHAWASAAQSIWPKINRGS